MPKVSSFDVMRVMGERDLDIRLSGLENISNMTHGKLGTKVTIGFPGNIIAQILNGELVGGFILCDKKQFDAIRKELGGE